MKIKFLIITLSFVFSFSFLCKIGIVHAQWAVFDAPTEVSTTLDTTGTWGSWFKGIKEKVVSAIGSQAIMLNKIAALLAEQKLVQTIIGDGSNGAIIRDFNNYLYVSPQQKAMTQMNSFFNTVSRGRLSSMNYEGVGPNYDAYLVAQARMAIAGQPFTTNLQDLVTDPSQLFDGGNMKGLMTYMQCANNVACYTLTSTAQYNTEFAKAQEIAKNENVNGFLPKKANGRITQPAAIAQNALLQIDQLGTQITMDAKSNDAESEIANTAAVTQIWQGFAISTAARLTNYGISDDAGKEAIRNKNDQFPFSLSYSSNGGIGLNAGGVRVSSGVAAWNGSMQIGNTCATGGFVIDGQGNTVTDINGKKKTCTNSSTGSVTKPTVDWTPPSITCDGDSSACNPDPIPAGTFVCRNNYCAKP